MLLTSDFLKKREISQMRIEELEDLEYHLQKMQENLTQKVRQIENDLAKIAEDQEKIRLEMEERKTKTG